MDEDSMHHALIAALRFRAVDVVTALEAGMAGAHDNDHLAHAASEGRVLFSANARDFHRLHGEWLVQGRDHSGIVLIHRQRYSIGERLRRLLRLISAKSAEEMVNQLEYL
jgi:hypothetical protein